MNRLIIWGYAGLIIALAGACLYARYLSGRVDTLTAENESLQATIEKQSATLKATDTELKKLSDNLAALRRKATKDEDKLNDALQKTNDNCINAPVSSDVLNLLRN